MTNQQIKDITPFSGIDDELLDEIAAIYSVEGSLDWIDDDLLSEVINSREE